RMKILPVLRDGELAVGEVSGRVGKTPTSVSQHLAKLRVVRMVHARQEGRACSTRSSTSMPRRW
ncbi:ArsR family transcriptional regulator, partial [Staphylococcus aureus]|nr:ArsR family transcriptional regulator [Staphylococcus aureus]